MITRFGMSKKFGMVGLEVAANQYLDNRTVLNCSAVTEAEVDEEVMRLIGDSYEEEKRLLTEHRETMDKIAAFLIEKETITGKEFMEIFHKAEQEAGQSKAGNEISGREDAAEETEKKAVVLEKN